MAKGQSSCLTQARPSERQAQLPSANAVGSKCPTLLNVPPLRNACCHNRSSTTDPRFCWPRRRHARERHGRVLAQHHKRSGLELVLNFPGAAEVTNWSNPGTSSFCWRLTRVGRSTTANAGARSDWPGLDLAPLCQGSRSRIEIREPNKPNAGKLRQLHHRNTRNLARRQVIAPFWEFRDPTLSRVGRSPQGEFRSGRPFYETSNSLCLGPSMGSDLDILELEWSGSLLVAASGGKSGMTKL